MSQGNPSCLRFSLEESVWFQRGQEVLDLISISLDPDILIQENDQYVTIQGALELSGEYKRNEIETMEDEDTFAAPKFIQVVEEREEGICEFNHFFPVDITIPKNRIENIRDIDVTVESFDYVFPERSCMKLTANLMIAGLYGEQQRTTSYETEKEEELESLYRSSAAVAEVDVSPFAQPSFDEMEVENDDRLELAVEVEEEEKEEKNEERMEFAVQYEEMQSEETKEVKSVVEEKVEIHVPFQAEARKQPESEVLEEVKVEERVQVKPEISFTTKRNEESPSFNDNVEERTENEERTESEESPLQVIEIVEEKIVQEESSDDVVLKKPSKHEEKTSEKDGKQKKKTKKKSMSLTEFFARKVEEEEVAKLKVCIVQNGDTVDMIAERYDIAVQQLLRVNHLEINQDIHEGQVLYIPVAVAH